MPNNCNCELSINLPEVEFYEDGVGSQAMRQNRWDLMKKLRDSLDDPDFGDEILNIMRPEPKDIGDDWYQWRCDNWGTKWSQVEDHECERDLHLIQISLVTAWGPPIDLCQYLTNELGFDIHCIWASCENEDWGIYEEGAVINFGHILRWDESELQEVHDLIETCESRMIQFCTLVDYSLFGHENNVGPVIEEHDREWIINEFQFLYEDILEKYEEWLEDQPDHKTLIKMKQELLERGEELLEWGKINEGDYLKLCNDLGKVTRERIKDLRDMIEPIVDNYSIDYPQDQMIDYYKTGEEPKLIECYY